VRRLALITILLSALGLAAAEKRPRVVASFPALYAWSVNVAGDFADVESLLPPRADPHTYSFTIADARRLNRADLIVINGLGLEGWLPNVRRTSPVMTNKLVSVTTGLSQQLLYGEQHHHHGPDSKPGGHGHEQANEHTWLDPVLAAHGVSNILAALQRIDPAHAAGYASNAQAYVARLHRLDADIRQKLAGATNRAIVTYHDAFAYFARRYDLQIAGVVEQQPGASPSPRHLSELRQTMRSRNITTVFVPPGGRVPLAPRLLNDFGARLAELDTLETGALSPSAYEKQMTDNATVLGNHLR
jgi:ABC-type Zn uptake system ZnuABC Zn-binding protein ZnuA